MRIWLPSVVEAAVFQLLEEAKPSWAEITRFDSSTWTVVHYLVDHAAPEPHHIRYLASISMSVNDHGMLVVRLFQPDKIEGGMKLDLADPELVSQIWAKLTCMYGLTKR